MAFGPREFAAAVARLTGLGLIGGSALVDTVNKIVPQLEDEVTVEVVGQPGATKQQLYFLALAAANGIVRRFDNLTTALAPSQGLLMIEYDAADHWVRCTIRYKWSCLAAAAGVPPRPGTFFDNLAVYRGPQCNVVGDDFDFVNQVLPGIPASARMPDAPQLPFDNQMILTGCPTTDEPTPAAVTQRPVPDSPLRRNGITVPSLNPKPPGDNRSRGNVVSDPQLVDVILTPGSTLSNPPPSYISCCDKILALIPLVYASLSQQTSHSQTEYTAPVAGPRGF
jgi:hypothetical protein